MVWVFIALAMGLIIGNIMFLRSSSKSGWLTKKQLDERGIKAQPKKDDDEDDDWGSDASDAKTKENKKPDNKE